MISGDGSSGAWAAIGAAAGAIGTKVVSAIFTSKRDRIDDAAAIRKELREEIAQMRERESKQAGEIEEWRRKYYELEDKMADMRRAMNLLQSTVDELTNLRKPST